MLTWWITQNLFVYDIKVGIYSKLNEYMVYTCTRVKVHSLTFVQGHSERNWISDERYRTIGPLVLNMYFKCLFTFHHHYLCQE